MRVWQTSETNFRRHKLSGRRPYHAPGNTFYEDIPKHSLEPEPVSNRVALAKAFISELLVLAEREFESSPRIVHG
jgi:hypothetical protein